MRSTEYQHRCLDKESPVRISQVVGPRTSVIVDEPDPVPGPREVLVEVLASGVCTSDLGAWRDHDASRPALRLGHEVAGRIVATGEEAGGWQVGDVVTGLGGPGFASRTLLDAGSLALVPAGFAPEHALGEPIANLVDAVARSPIVPGARVAVVGMGFMGLGLVQLVHATGPSSLVAVDTKPAAHRRALAMGADAAYTPDELPEQFRTAPAPGEADGRFDVVIEAAGATPALTLAGSLVRPYGTLTVVGYHHDGTAPMDLELWYKAVTIVNGFCPSRRRLTAALVDGIDQVSRHRFDYAPLITHKFGLEGVDDAFALMESRPADFVKSVVLP